MYSVQRNDDDVIRNGSMTLDYFHMKLKHYYSKTKRKKEFNEFSRIRELVLQCL